MQKKTHCLTLVNNRTNQSFHITLILANFTGLRYSSESFWRPTSVRHDVWKCIHGVVSAHLQKVYVKWKYRDASSCLECRHQPDLCGHMWNSLSSLMRDKSLLLNSFKRNLKISYNLAPSWRSIVIVAPFTSTCHCLDKLVTNLFSIINIYWKSRV